MIDSKGMRIGLLNEHKDLLPVKLFDGSIMFLPDKLPEDVSWPKAYMAKDVLVNTEVMFFLKIARKFCVLFKKERKKKLGLPPPPRKKKRRKWGHLCWGMIGF